MIVLEHTLKFIEIVLKYENDFKISEFYPSRIFVKVKKLRDFFLEISNFLENGSGRGSCPSSFPSDNQVDGSPLVAIGSTSHPGGNQVGGLPLRVPKQSLSGPEGAAARRYS